MNARKMDGLPLRLKVVLLERGITQGQLATAIGRTQQHISRVMRGHVCLSDSDRAKVAAFLRVSMRALSHERSTQK